VSRPWRRPQRAGGTWAPPTELAEGADQPSGRLAPQPAAVHHVPAAEPDALALGLAEGAGAAKALEAAARRLEQEASHDHRADLEDWGCARCALMEEAARIVRSLGREPSPRWL